MLVVPCVYSLQEMDMVLVVAGRVLGRADGAGKFVKIADLPVEGLRFGQRVSKYGVASEILLFGQANKRGVVFGLRPNGEYLKITEVNAPITAVTGFLKSTVIATDGKLVCLTPGQKPKVFFQVPRGSGPIISLLACPPRDEQFENTLFLVATKDGVFGVEGGHAYLLLAGIGGELRATGLPRLAAWSTGLNIRSSPDLPRYAAWLTDGQRHTAAMLTLQRIEKD